MCASHQVRKVSLRVASSPIRPDSARSCGLDQQRFQRVPQVGNRGFRGRTVPCRPDRRAQLGRGAPDAVLVLFYDVRHMDYRGPCRFSHARSPARIGALVVPGQHRTIADAQPRAGPLPGGMANRTGPASMRCCRRRSPRHGDAQRPNAAHPALDNVLRQITAGQRALVSRYVTSHLLPAETMWNHTANG